MLGGVASLGELYSWVLSASWNLFGTFPKRFFHILYYSIGSITMILESAASTYFPLLFSCARYRVWVMHLVHGIPVPY